MKKGNKQCLLDTPRRVTVNNKKDLYQNAKSQRKPVDWPIQALYICTYKSHGIIKIYKGKLL